MLKTMVILATAALLTGCSDNVCAEAAEIDASCISGTAQVDEDIECGALAACEAQCVVDRRSDYCDIVRETADTEVVRDYDDCVAACATIGTDTETEGKKTEK